MQSDSDGGVRFRASREDELDEGTLMLRLNAVSIVRMYSTRPFDDAGDIADADLRAVRRVYEVGGRDICDEPETRQTWNRTLNRTRLNEPNLASGDQLGSGNCGAILMLRLGCWSNLPRLCPNQLLIRQLEKITLVDSRCSFDQIS